MRTPSLNTRSRLWLSTRLMSVIAEKIDTHRERGSLSARSLAKMADRTGSVLFGIAHFNKGASTDAASLITGSGAFKNVRRSVFGSPGTTPTIKAMPG